MWLFTIQYFDTLRRTYLAGKQQADAIEFYFVYADALILLTQL